MTIILPLPPVALNPHAKGSRWPKIKATKEYRATAALIALGAKNAVKEPIFPLPKVTVYATYYMAKKVPNDQLYRPLDSTNAAAALKAAVDGLVDAGIVEKDDHRHLRMMPPVLLRSKKEHEGRCEVVLEIELWADKGVKSL